MYKMRICVCVFCLFVFTYVDGLRSRYSGMSGDGSVVQTGGAHGPGRRCTLLDGQHHSRRGYKNTYSNNYIASLFTFYLLISWQINLPAIINRWWH